MNGHAALTYLDNARDHVEHLVEVQRQLEAENQLLRERLQSQQAQADRYRRAMRTAVTRLFEQARARRKAEQALADELADPYRGEEL